MKRRDRLSLRRLGLALLVTICLPLIARPALGQGRGLLGGPILPQSQRDRQRSAAKAWMPAAVQLRATASAPLAERPPLRVRVWACRDYQDQTVLWKPRYEALLRRVNHHLSRWPGVRLEVVELRSWEQASMAAPLPALLDALVQQDGGEDVDFVIGLASAVSTMPTSIHALGVARPLSKHFVMRNVTSLAEHAAAQGELDQLDESERQHVLGARKEHRELVVFLHEWGHALGALHARHGTLIMNPEYHQDQARVDDGNARLMEAALRRWSEEDRRLLWQEQARLLQAAPDEEWEAQDTAERLAWLSSRLAGGGAAGSAPAERTSAGRVAEALAACRQAGAGGARLAAVMSACATARAQAPGDPEPLLVLAQAQLAAGTIAEALALGREAEARLAPQGDAPRWLALAGLYRRARAVSLALGAARRAGEESARSYEAWQRGLWQRFALPPDAAQRGLAAQREPELLGAMEAAQVAVAEGRVRVAQQLIGQIERDFPKLAAGPLLRCGLELRAGRLALARAACGRALSSHEPTGAVLLLSGLVAQAAGQGAEARRLLRRALALLPEAEEGWQALAALLPRGDAAAQAELRADYQRLVGRPARF